MGSCNVCLWGYQSFAIIDVDKTAVVAPSMHSEKQTSRVNMIGFPSIYQRVWRSSILSKLVCFYETQDSHLAQYEATSLTQAYVIVEHSR